MGLHLLEWCRNCYESWGEYRCSEIYWSVGWKFKACINSAFPSKWLPFQDDNASVHQARIVREYIARNHIKCMSWPPQSPDINIIENIWLHIKKKLNCKITRINSNEDLFSEIKRIWQDITTTFIKKLYKSLPKRILNVIRLKGNLTKYWGKYFLILSYILFIYPKFS